MQHIHVFQNFSHKTDVSLKKKMEWSGTAAAAVPVLEDCCHWLSLGACLLLGWRPSLLGWRPSLLGCRPSLLGCRPLLSSLEAIACRLEAIAIRLEAIAIRLQAIAIRLQAIAFFVGGHCL